MESRRQHSASTNISHKINQKKKHLKTTTYQPIKSNRKILSKFFRKNTCTNQKSVIPLQRKRKKMVRIAQLVRASDCGPEGRGFETHSSPFQSLSEFRKAFFIHNCEFILKTYSSTPNNHVEHIQIQPRDKQ